ncbi:OmpA family protein [Larkinella insperata]|uniref:OmpA family protein n=1 Tax=Larkinella insperata TaxID=332158 RepID=A0ABW3QFR7_9BACT|nr:OmpA family protein [Larkinella insperata]
MAFAKSGADANFNSVLPLLDSLALYLKSNPGKQLQLTGFYDGREHNTTSEPNLGAARASSIRAYLTGLGVPENQFQIVGIEKSNLSFTPAGDSLYGGVQFAFPDAVLVKGNKPTGEDSLANGATFTSIFEPMDLYFNTGKTDYIQTAETTEFLERTKAYLKEHPDQKLLVTGHTDNSGPDALNLMLSKKRAAAVKTQFIQAGIASSQIEVAGKGESRPVASNNTADGRRANRRTSVVVTK